MAVSPLLHCYTLTHFVLSFLAADFINASVKVEISSYNTHTHSGAPLTLQSAPVGEALVPVAYCVWGLSNIGLLYDTSVWGWASELLRYDVTFVTMSRCHDVTMS